LKILFVLPSNPFPRDYNMLTTLKHAGHQVDVIYWDKHADVTLTGVCNRAYRFSYSGGELRKLLLLPIWILFVSIRLISSKFDVVQARTLPGLLAVFPTLVCGESGIAYDLSDFTADSSTLASGLPRPIRSFVARFETRLAQRADALLVASIGQLSRQIAWPKDKPWTIVYNSPESGAPASPAEEGGDLRILYAGVLTRQRVPGIIAVAQAVRRLPGVTMTVAGRGDSARAIATLANISPQIEYLGFVSREKVVEMTASCTCIVAPYDPSELNNVIGMPNKLLEAMSSGKPVLVSRGTMAGEVVENHNCGIAVRYADIDDAERALRALADPEVRRALGANGKRAFAEEYSWAIGSGAYLRLCESLR
jgi:glycosyltransferase involved in cell wall biosynthesis